MNKKAFIAAALGAIVQYYDYSLFGLMAATISKTFFPNDTAVTQLLKAYVILSIGVAAKPLGAAVLGRIGDLYGRSRTLTISLIGTAIPSVVIAFTPGYETIGMLSTLILLIYRMAVCMFVSSGTDGIRLFIFEHIGEKRQCLGNGLVVMATQIGVYLASLSVLFFASSDYPSWLWRGAFAVGAMLGFLVILIRRYLEVDKIEEDLDKTDKYYDYKNVRLWSILKEHVVLFMLGTVLAGCIGASYQLNIIFLGTYIFKILGIVEQNTMQIYVSKAIVIYMFTAIGAGALADWWGRKLVASIGYIGIVGCTVANILLVERGEFSHLAFYGNTASLALLLMPSFAILKQSIPKYIRYRLFSMAHACGSILLSGTSPFISTLLYEKTSVTWLPLAYFLFLMTVLFGMLYLIGRAGRMLRAKTTSA